MNTVWIVCEGDQTNPKALFRIKSEADLYATTITSGVVFEGRIGDVFFVNLTPADFS